MKAALSERLTRDKADQYSKPERESLNSDQAIQQDGAAGNSFPTLSARRHLIL